MNKKSTVELSTATPNSSADGPPVSTGPGDPAFGCQLDNWAGNYHYGTTNLYRHSTIDQVRKFVTECDSLRVLGTRHCFNGLADSKYALITLSSMDQIVSLDRKLRTVTVESGMSYGQLCPYLHEQGFALHNLASLPQISIVGACVTGTHGSGVKNGNLATAVSALDIVTASGDTLTISRAKDGDMFFGAVVNLGALGVVTKVTLDVEPTFRMRQDVFENLPLAQLTDNYEKIVSSGYSVSLFTDWQNERVAEVWVKQRVENGEISASNPDFYGAWRASRNLHPIAGLSAENCTEQMGVPAPWYERLPHFRIGSTPSSGRELQSEYFVPREQAVEAILAIERLRDRIGPHLMISELRTVDADRLWMSPCYERPSLAIHFTWKPAWDPVREVLPLIEKALAPFDARPHWGKLFTMEPAQVQSRYERLADFKDLLKTHDPGGKFRNEFLARTLYS